MANACAQCQSPLPAQTNVCARCGFVNPFVKQKTPVVVIVLVVLGVLVVVGGVLGVLAVYGVRKYIANAKTAEARATLGSIAQDAVQAYEGSTPRRLCPSASAAVPANPSMIRGHYYRAPPTEWKTDSARDAGFACLKFEMTSPQYFQYDYKATATGFVATAHGDLNGDGKLSTFELTGQIVGDKLIVAPAAIHELDADE